MKLLVTLAATAATLLSINPAMAAPLDLDRVVIPTADLDLARPSGMSQLDRRLTAAAEQICDAQLRHSDTDPRFTLQCMADVRATAKPQIEEQVAAANARDAAPVAMASRR